MEFRGWVYRDGLRPVAEVDALGSLVARYVYADAGAAAGWNAPDYIELFDEEGDPTNTYLLIKDQVGTVELVTDVATGQIVQRMEHDEFGRVLYDSNPGFQPFGFAGGIYDADTGLVRFGARDYDPELGRWTTRDPILFGGGQTNLYQYVDGDPVGGIDVDGEFGIGVIGIAEAAGAIVGAIEGAAAASGVGVAVAGSFAVGYGIGEAIAPWVMDPLFDLVFNQGKGERGRTAKPEGTMNPGKKFRWDEKSGRWKYKDANGKWKLKPPGFTPPGGQGLVASPGSDGSDECE